MSPVEKRSGGHAGRALAVSGVAVAVLLLGLYVAARFASDQPSIDVGLGDQTFHAGNAARLAAEIDDRGPITYPDVSGNKERDIIVQHLGNDPARGWYAFRAQPADRDRECTWEWQPDEELFRAKCDPALTAPADGEGLSRYPVKVIDGNLDIDLNFADRPTTTSTTTTVIESGDVPTTTAAG